MFVGCHIAAYRASLLASSDSLNCAEDGRFACLPHEYAIKWPASGLDPQIVNAVRHEELL